MASKSRLELPPELVHVRVRAQEALDGLNPAGPPSSNEEGKGMILSSRKEVGWGVRVAIEAGKQLATDGKITNFAGLIGAAAGAGAFGGDAMKYSTTLTTGLSMLEGKLRGHGDNAMQWVSLATAAMFDSGMLFADGTTAADRGLASRASSPQYFDKAGEINWKVVAVQAVGAAIVADHMGEDAAIGYVGNALGEFAVQAGGRYADKVLAEQAQKPTFASDVARRNALLNPMNLPTRSVLADADAASQVEPASRSSGFGVGRGITDGETIDDGVQRAAAGPSVESADSGLTREALRRREIEQRNATPVPQTVRAGDYGGSLERIARDSLGPDATQRQVNEMVGQLFEINRFCACLISIPLTISAPYLSRPTVAAGVFASGSVRI